MSHRKREHLSRVRQCKNEQNGNCLHGSTFCWYKHTDVQKENDNIIINENDDETNDAMKKLFNMMENFAQRLIDIEKLTRQNREIIIN